MLLWQLWYADGSTFSNLDGGPEDAPATGVQCVAQREESWGKHVVQVQSGGDWYVYDAGDDYWYRSDVDGLHRRLLEKPFKLAVKAGEYLPTMAYNRIVDRAREDAKGW